RHELAVLSLTHRPTGRSAQALTRIERGYEVLERCGGAHTKTADFPGRRAARLLHNTAKLSGGGKACEVSDDGSWVRVSCSGRRSRRRRRAASQEPSRTRRARFCPA